MNTLPTVTNRPDIKSVKFYKSGFKLIRVDDTEKLYKFKNVQSVTFPDNNTVEVINTQVIAGETVLKSLTLERFPDDPSTDIGKILMRYWEQYQAKSINDIVIN